MGLQKLASHGFWTTVRINPLFPIYPDGYYSNPNFDNSQSIEPFNFFSWDMIEAIAQHQIPTVLVGMVRLYRPNFRFMQQALGYDMRAHFEADAREERASLHFSAAETTYYYQRIKALCDQHGVHFFQLATSAMILVANALDAISHSGATPPIAVMR